MDRHGAVAATGDISVAFSGLGAAGLSATEAEAVRDCCHAHQRTVPATAQPMASRPTPPDGIL
jgi:hypothetical protein